MYYLQSSELYTPLGPIPRPLLTNTATLVPVHHNMQPGTTVAFFVRYFKLRLGHIIVPNHGKKLFSLTTSPALK